MTETNDTWPAGATWVFQGTVAEDGTGGTHVCTLTVTPGAGNEMQLLYANTKLGNTATAQVFSWLITDGTNNLGGFENGVSVTTANTIFDFPSTSYTATGSNFGGINVPLIISGAQTLKIIVSTAAISVTQTFAVVCRIKGALPTAVLADSVGTPALTVNTNKVF